MSFEVFKKVIDQFAATGGGDLGLTPVVGDALIDKELPQKIAYARLQGAIREIGLTTNAILLSQELFERMVKSGLNRLFISMTGFNRDEYRRIYRNDSYLKVRGNLIRVAESKFFKNCEVVISSRTDDWFWKLRKDYQLFKELGFKLTSTSFYDNWSGRITNADLSGKMMIRPLREKTLPCSILYSGPTVLANGKITACGCRDMNGDSELVVGDIAHDQIGDAWTNGRMENLRRRFLTKQLPDICRDCRHYTPVSLRDLAPQQEVPHLKPAIAR